MGIQKCGGFQSDDHHSRYFTRFGSFCHLPYILSLCLNGMIKRKRGIDFLFTSAYCNKWFFEPLILVLFQ